MPQVKVEPDKETDQQKRSVPVCVGCGGEKVLCKGHLIDHRLPTKCGPESFNCDSCGGSIPKSGHKVHDPCEWLVCSGCLKLDFDCQCVSR